MSYNAAEGKDVAPLQPDPALSKDQLRVLAGSDVWFTADAGAGVEAPAVG